MNKYNVQTTNKYNSSAPATVQTPYDSDASAFGVAVNTIKGLFPAALQVGKDIGQGILRSAASIAPTIAGASNDIFGTNFSTTTTAPNKTVHPLAHAVFTTLYGDKPIEDLGTQILNTENSIKSSPFAQKLGLDKFAGPLSFGGVVGSTVLDLTPFGGSEKNAVKSLVKETDETIVKGILGKMKIAPEIADRFAAPLAAAKTEGEVEDILHTVKATHGLDHVVARVDGMTDDEISKLEKSLAEGEGSAAVNADMRPHLKFDEQGRPVAYTDRERAILESGAPQPVLSEQISPKLLETAQKDWTDSYLPKFQQLHEQGIKISDELKTTRSASTKGILRSQLDSIVSQQDEMEGEFLAKWRQEAGLPEHVPQTRGVDMRTSIDNSTASTLNRRGSQMQRFEEVLQETQNEKLTLEQFLKKADEVHPAEDPSVRADLSTVYNKLFNREGFTPSARDLSSAVQDVEQSRARMRSIDKILKSSYPTPASMLAQLPQDELRSVRNLIDDKIRTVKNKVHFFDYLATPEFVLEKIGLGREAKLLQTAKDGYAKELPKAIDRISSWRKEAGTSEETSQRIFRFLDGNPAQPTLPDNELKVAMEIKQYLKEWADRLDLPQGNRIASYITHIFEPDLVKKEFDDDLARLITDKTPGSVYDPFLQKRLGQMGYVEDTWRALDAYTKRAVRKANFDPALEKLSAAAEKLDLNSEKYVQRLASRVNLRPTEMDNLLDNFLKSVPGIGYRLGQRPVANITQSIRRTFYRGTLGLNIGSALRNLSQVNNTYSKLGERYTISGYVRVFANLVSRNLDELKNVGVLEDNFVQDRKLGVYKSALQKLDKGLFVFFDTAEKINRGAAYYGAKSKALNKGLSEREAVDYAKRIVRETQFAFGNVDSPVAMSSDIVKTMGQLQTFNLKQTEFLARMVKNKEFAGLARWTIGSLGFIYSLGRLFGMTPAQLIPSIGLGNSPFVSGISSAFQSINPNNSQKEQDEAQSQLGRSLTSLIPGGAQLRKSLEGYRVASEGKDTTASGRVRFKVRSDSDKIRAIIFGKSTLPQAKEYYNSLDAAGSKTSGGSRYNQ